VRRPTPPRDGDTVTRDASSSGEAPVRDVHDVTTSTTARAASKEVRVVTYRIFGAQPDIVTAEIPLAV
jgi:hypothetical protein